MPTDIPAGGPILIFDGVCNICAFGVGIVLRHDRDGVFRFAFAQGPVGSALKKRYGLPDGDLETVALVEGGQCYVKSTAALRVLARLPWPWRLGVVFRVLPRALRDFLYTRVARNRYRWFGQKESCFLPPPHVRDRFLDPA
jgi:predicted DCC family thiol-disulfide oxidoreductase YuxK